MTDKRRELQKFVKQGNLLHSCSFNVSSTTKEPQTKSSRLDTQSTTSGMPYDFNFVRIYEPVRISAELELGNTKERVSSTPGSARDVTPTWPLTSSTVNKMSLYFFK